MLKKLFGGKKKESFFLELEESQVEPPAQTSQEPSEPAAGVAGEEKPVQPTATAPAKSAKKTSIKKSARAPKSKTAPAAAPAATVASKPPEPQEVEFATKYLIVPTMSRRRPGPSLNAFKDMARQVKVPAAKA